MITDYCIIDGDTCDDLSETVVLMLKDGWQPFGNAFTWQLGRDAGVPVDEGLHQFILTFCQPMVKYT